MKQYRHYSVMQNTFYLVCVIKQQQKGMQQNCYPVLFQKILFRPGRYRHHNHTINLTMKSRVISILNLNDYISHGEKWRHEILGSSQFKTVS